MKKPVRRWRGLLIVAAVLIVAAMLLAACGSDDASTDASPTAGGEPKAGGKYNFAARRRADQHRAAQHAGVRGRPGRSTRCSRASSSWRCSRTARTEAVPDLAESPWRSTRTPRSSRSRSIRASCSSRRSAARSRRRTSSTPGATTPTPRTSRPRTYIIAPIEGHRPRDRLRRRPRPQRRQGPRRLHARGHAAVPVRRLLHDAGAPDHARVPRRLRRGDRPQGVLRQAGRHRPVHGRGVEAQPVHHAHVKDPTTGTRTAPPRTRPAPGYVPTINMPIYNETQHRVARLPEGRRSTTRTSRRATSRPPRTTPRPRTAPGPSRPTRARPCTSSASR